MRIRMKVEMSGTRNGEPWPKRGEVAELPTAEAAHLVGAGIAEEVRDEPPPVETATASEAETFELPTAEAAHLVGAGIAEEVRDEPPPVETATASEAETFELPTAEAATPPATDERRGRGRPRKPRDDQGNIVRE